jgi:glucose-1-phosphatase
MKTPRFIYFDLGNVLLNFDHRLACRQMGEVAGIAPDRVWQLVFASGLEMRYEAGELDDLQFYQAFCNEFGVRPDFDRLVEAASNIFQINLSIVPLLAQLAAARWPLGILSNTNSAHWALCSMGRYGFLLQGFSVHALSYQIGCCKPEAKIYQRAAELAGVAPQEIFYVDDVLANVDGACRAGFDAVQYTSTSDLATELRQRGVVLNY